MSTLSKGAFIIGASGIALPAYTMGKIPSQMPPGKSIYELNGKVTVNNKPANKDTYISTNSTVKTGNNSRIIFVVGKDAFMLRENSNLELKGSTILTGLRLITGKLLSVFGKRTKKEKLGMKTVVATIGIRGTGIYVESEPDQTYVCTCYGSTTLASATDSASTEAILTKHHDTPRYIMAKGASGKKIKEAPVINHTDDELELIEALTGRTTPFIPEEY